MPPRSSNRRRAPPGPHGLCTAGTTSRLRAGRPARDPPPRASSDTSVASRRYVRPLARRRCRGVRGTLAPALEPAVAPAPGRTSDVSPLRSAPRSIARADLARRRSAVRGLASSRASTAIVRGRAWIPLLGVLLVVIVGMRVEVLKLGSSVGRELEQATQLESGNAALRAQVSELSGNQRIEQLAATMGMVMPGPMDIHFVRASAAGNVERGDQRDPRARVTDLPERPRERTPDRRQATRGGRRHQRRRRARRRHGSPRRRPARLPPRTPTSRSTHNVPATTSDARHADDWHGGPYNAAATNTSTAGTTGKYRHERDRFDIHSHRIERRRRAATPPATTASESHHRRHFARGVAR